jgi:uncharacterized protein
VATKYIKGYGIRIAFGLAVIGCFISVFLKLLPIYVPSVNKICDIIATYMILGLVSALAIYITVKMVQGAKAELAMKKAKAAS